MTCRPPLAVACACALVTLTAAVCLGDPPAPKSAGKAVAAPADAAKPAADQADVAAPAEFLKPLPGAKEVQVGLVEGYKLGSKNMTSAQAKFEAARRLSPHDPRIDYAEGLACCKQAQWARAQDQFERSLKHQGLPYWPAWQGWVWCAFHTKQYDVGFVRVREMAKQVAAAAKPMDMPGPVEVGQTKWIARLMSAASRSDASGKSSEAWRRTADELEGDLGPALFKAYEAGRLEFFNEQQEILKQSQAKAEVKADKDKQAIEIEKAKIDGSLAKASREKEETKIIGCRLEEMARCGDGQSGQGIGPAGQGLPVRPAAGGVADPVDQSHRPGTHRAVRQ